MSGKKLRKGLLEEITNRTGQLDDLLEETWAKNNFDSYAKLLEQWTELVKLYHSIAMEGKDEKA